MKVEKLLGQPGEWLKGTGPESDVVVSSRVRLARNIQRFPFLTAAPPKVRSEIERHVRPRLEDSRVALKLTYWNLGTLSALDRLFLVERHLISREHAQGNGQRGVAIAPDESVSIMVNEEDHLRIQVIRSGLQLEEAYEDINRMDTVLEGILHFSFNPRFGYLTACPTNVGTGLRISVMMHLPAVVLAKQMDKVLQSLQRLSYTARGLYGEGTSPLGDFYQISNQVTLGKSERDIIAQLRQVVPEILKFERVWRHKLMEEEPRKVEDRVWRAYGIMKHARRISAEEAVEHLSILRLGVHLGIVGVAPRILNDLFLTTQTGHLQKLQGKELEADAQDEYRGEIIRRTLGSA